MTDRDQPAPRTTPRQPVRCPRCDGSGQIAIVPMNGSGTRWRPCDVCGGAHPAASNEPETVDHPAHYGGADNDYEAIKVIEAWNLDFNLGNVAKYICRAGKKGDEIEDLQKALWYLRRAIEHRDGEPHCESCDKQRAKIMAMQRELNEHEAERVREARGEERGDE